MIIDQQLKYYYEKASYEILRPAIRLTIGESSPQLSEFLIDNQSMHWAIISAFNPSSKLVDNEQNKAQHLELIKQLGLRKIRWVNCLNRDPSGRWPDEISCFILDLKKKEATQLAKSFGQKALVYGTLGSEAELIWTGI